jgi:hypothetical protein
MLEVSYTGKRIMSETKKSGNGHNLDLEASVSVHSRGRELMTFAAISAATESRLGFVLCKYFYSCVFECPVVLRKNLLKMILAEKEQVLFLLGLIGLQWTQSVSVAR